MRLELQQEQGDTEILSDGHTVSLYDAASNTLYRYTPPSHAPAEAAQPDETHEVPSVAKIEEAIAKLTKHADVSGATPTNVAGQPAYTVRVSPNESGSLLGGAELSFDATNGIPLRGAIYSSTSSSPVIELAATEVSYGPVDPSVFAISPPANAKVEEVSPSNSGAAKSTNQQPDGAGGVKLTTDGPRACHDCRARRQNQGRGIDGHAERARGPAQGHDQRHQRQRAADRARHAADLPARGGPVPARRLRHARRDRSGRAGPLA